MSDESDAKRDRLHEFLQSDQVPTSAPEGSLLVGWVIVTAWVDPAGERWQAKAYAAELAPWMADGLLHEALYGDWDKSE